MSSSQFSYHFESVGVIVSHDLITMTHFSLAQSLWLIYKDEIRKIKGVDAH